MSTIQDMDDDYRRLQKHLYYTSMDYENGRISRDKYISILEKNYEFLDKGDKAMVNEWRLKKDKDKRDKIMQDALRRKQNEKNAENNMYIFFVVLSLIVAFIMFFFTKK